MSSSSPCIWITVALALGSSSVPALAQSVPVTDTLREFTNLNIETVRGLAPATNGTLYALNTHASQIVVHSDADPEPEALWQTLLNPVSMALWDDEKYLLVVGGGTHALALHDAVNGDILNVVQLSAEPADLVVDQAGKRAFVACQGANEVVQVDLNSFTIAARYAIPAESPRMLYLDASDDGVFVYVAPFLSGNNSTVLDPGGSGGARMVVQDLNGFPYNLQLPDEDLFVINPSQPPATAVTPVLRRAGTLLTGHGRNPVTGAYWMLNVESINNDPLLNTEPRVRGRFALNRLTIAATLGGATPPPLPTKFIDLDDTNPSTPGGQYTPSRAMGFPFALEFAANGFAFIASPLNDRVAMHGPNGQWLGLIQLPDGSIPFDLALDAVTGTRLYTYCWGTNTVQVNDLLQPGVSSTLQLGVDPTPERIREGRRLWYDADRSLNARVSCNTCHPGGRSDLLGWSISDDPNDPKDLMVTQSLLSIEDTFPYHWRGERDLLAFNGAFPGLLGAASALSTNDGGEFEAFQAFVFSLQAPANPRQHLSRQVVDPPVLPVFTDQNPYSPTFGQSSSGSAVAGRTLFLTKSTFLNRTCASCHQPPTGSNGDFVNEAARPDAPTAKFIEVPHLRELRHKDQPVMTFSLLGAQAIRGRNGFGVTHDGEFPNIFSFLNRPSTFQTTLQEAANVTAFVQQWDNGIAPTAHAAFMVDQQHPNGAADVATYLTAQAGSSLRWIDCVAFGTFRDPTSGLTLKGRWRYDFNSQTFTQNDVAATTTLPVIASQASLGLARMVFLGIPPLNGIRFAWDPDNDHLIDWVETAFSTDRWDPDSDDDGQPDEYEVMNPGDPNDPNVLASDQGPPGIYFPQVRFVTSSLAKVTVSTDEDVWVTSMFSTPGGTQRTFFDPVWSRDKTFALQGLQASTPLMPWTPASVNNYTPLIELTDRAGKTSTVTLNCTAGDMILPPSTNGRQAPFVLTSLNAVEGRSGGTLTLSATATVRHRYHTPGNTDLPVVQGWVVLAQLVVGPAPGTGGTNWEFVPSTNAVPAGTTLSGATFTIVEPSGATRPFTTVPGPFLFSAPSDSSGNVTIDVSQSGLVTGQRVRLNILGILEPQLGSIPPLKFNSSSLATYQAPSTPPEKRGLPITF